jgi:hypothetical protein
VAIEEPPPKKKTPTVRTNGASRADRFRLVVRASSSDPKKTRAYVTGWEKNPSVVLVKLVSHLLVCLQVEQFQESAGAAS